MIEINSMAIFSMCVIVFSVATPLWGIWDGFFKRKPYITDVVDGNP